MAAIFKLPIVLLASSSKLIVLVLLAIAPSSSLIGHTALRGTDDAFKIAVKMSLGQTPNDQSGLGWCHMCRKKVDGDPYHGFVCVSEKRRSRNAAHDEVKHLISNTCTKFGLCTGIKPNVYGNEEDLSGARPDLIWI